MDFKKTSIVTEVPEKDLWLLEYKSAGKQALEFEQIFEDQINIFTFKGVTYIGLESRRLDYERDKLSGTNMVEDYIKKGFYD